MEYRAIILLLTLYFIRPQDWVPGMAGWNVAKPVMLLAIMGMMSRNRKSLLNAPWPFMATPHEWIMAVYTIYILFTTPELGATVSDLMPKVLAFYLALHSLTSEQRLHNFVKWWRWSLIAVAVMGASTLIGVDFTGSQAATDQNQGRLSLHHWMLDNANALGHTLITLLPLLYFGVVKDRSISRGLAAVFPAALACLCLWSTQSKGAYLVGAGLLVFSVLLGRPWWLKISILALALGVGGTALSYLPRMNEMGNWRADEGVVGRLMAWEMARNVTHTTVTGEGYRAFNATIKWEGKLIPKATHSAYVQVGGDLGIPGLMLYLSVLCCGLRTMLAFHGVSRELDRLRGALFSLLLGYMASGWMINRSYHLEFFLIMAGIAAYQRLCVRAAGLETPAVPLAAAASRDGVGLLAWSRKRAATAAPVRNVKTLAQRLSGWRRYGLLDAGLAFVSLQAVVSIWDYILSNLY